MDNIIMIISIIVVLCAIAYCIYEFYNLGKEKQIKMLKEWLLLAVVEAEKALGSNTGQIKLRYVYDLFITKFKYLALIISFNQFSLLVDEALVTMRNMISNNKQVENYITKE
jgi:hypothetical protein